MKHVWLVATETITRGPIGTVHDGNKFTCPGDLAQELLRHGLAVPEGQYQKKQKPLPTKKAGGAAKRSASSPVGQASRKPKSAKPKKKAGGTSQSTTATE
jgi:hypothetical protein